MTKPHTTNLRISVLLYLFLFIAIGLSIRVLYLASIDISNYTAFQNTSPILKRGEILDRSGRILAINDELYSVYANPPEIANKEETAKFLAEYLDEDFNEIFKKINTKKKFVWIKRFIHMKNKNSFPLKKGIGLSVEYKRIYPNNSLASHVLGFCNIDNEGVEGLEKSMNHLLKGNSDETYNIQLTIDSVIQANAEKALKKACEMDKPETASLILIDGYTGEILSLANYPNFDPNFYSEYQQKNFRNTSVFYQFEPGSVFKIFSIGAVMDTGAINDESLFHCYGNYEKEGMRVKCTGYHPNIDIEGIFKYSCNVGTLQIMEHIQPSELYNYLRKFGFGLNTGIELPGEQTGIFRPISQWSKRSMLAIPIGQEISVNALQIAQAATVFVNDGELIKVSIIKKIYSNDGVIIRENRPEIAHRVLQPGVSAHIINDMKSATDPGGTVSQLQIPGLRFASKSGTAQVYDVAKKAYSDTDVNSSLIVLFPLEQPRYIIYATFHNPRAHVRWGGIIVANLIRDFLHGLTGYLVIQSPDYPSLSLETITQQDMEIITNYPHSMPSLYGLSLTDVTTLFSKSAIKIIPKGNGFVTSQSIEVGKTIQGNETLLINLE